MQTTINNLRRSYVAFVQLGHILTFASSIDVYDPRTRKRLTARQLHTRELAARR